jgi:hypothetical protein
MEWAKDVAQIRGEKSIRNVSSKSLKGKNLDVGGIKNL